MTIRRDGLATTWILLAVLAAVGRAAGQETIAPIGEDLSAFRDPTGDWLVATTVKPDPDNPKRLKADTAADEGPKIIVNGATGRTSNLLTKAEHGDVAAHVEFMVPQGSNSGVYFMGRYEIQVFDSYGKQDVQHSDCGGVYQRWKGGKGFEGHPPRVNASKPPGQWQSFDVVFRAPRFDERGKKIANACFVQVKYNGVVVHENVELTGPTRASTYQDEQPTGPLMLQGDHGPVAYRNITLRPVE